MKIVLSMLFVMLVFCAASSVQAQQTTEQKSFETPEEVVTELYDLVSFEAGKTPDWQKVRALFHDEAIIVLRASRTKMKVLSVDGFVADFVNFIQQARVDTTGFIEKIISMKPVVFGNMAQCFVVFEVTVTHNSRMRTR